MENNKKMIKQGKQKESKELALHYMKTLVEVARESFLILDSGLRVLMANPVFYQRFRVTPEQTENKFLYELGNGQWDIPELKRLLKEILPDKKTVKNYEVSRVFETIGTKTILLNARQIDAVKLIILAMEDITDRKQLEEKLAEHARGLEAKIDERTGQLANRIAELEALNATMVGRELKMVELKKEIKSLQRRIKNGNGNGNHKNGRHK